jgi:hypothetical protein
LLGVSRVAAAGHDAVGVAGAERALLCGDERRGRRRASAKLASWIVASSRPPSASWNKEVLLL